MTEAQQAYWDNFEGKSTEAKLYSTLNYIMNLETTIHQHSEKIEALENENSVQLSIIKLLLDETKWANEQLGANGKKPEITERINADIQYTIEQLEAKSAWTEAEGMFYMKVSPKKWQRLKATGDIRTKFNGSAQMVFRDDILDKSDL